ncbi:MAG TPA: hypothetical protein EYH34_03385, partial [Planctomycetes bacterium]|nr:hypothetical protein [Planctomycetota bacterium]
MCPRRKSDGTGWSLPRRAERKAEPDRFDVVEGLVIRGRLAVEVLKGTSVLGGLAASWPRARITGKTVVNALVSHWRQFGWPDLAPFGQRHRLPGS